MKVLVIDAQGGGIGRQVISAIRQRGTSISYCNKAVLAAELPVAILRLSITQHFKPALHNSCTIKAPVIPVPITTISVEKSSFNG